MKNMCAKVCVKHNVCMCLNIVAFSQFDTIARLYKFQKQKCHCGRKFVDHSSRYLNICDLLVKQMMERPWKII